MPIVFGRQARSIEEIAEVFRLFGDKVRGTYRARYVWTPRSDDPYAGTSLERPESLRENPAGVVFPWEQIFVSAAACAGSDYPMIAAHRKIALARVELVLEGVFDPRFEFDGLGGFDAPREVSHAYAGLHVAVKLTSNAPQEVLRDLHARVLFRNMVLDALRGVPRTDELTILAT